MILNNKAIHFGTLVFPRGYNFFDKYGKGVKTPEVLYPPCFVDDGKDTAVVIDQIPYYSKKTRWLPINLPPKYNEELKFLAEQFRRGAPTLYLMENAFRALYNAFNRYNTYSPIYRELENAAEDANKTLFQYVFGAARGEVIRDSKIFFQILLSKASLIGFAKLKDYPPGTPFPQAQTKFRDRHGVTVFKVYYLDERQRELAIRDGYAF